MGKLSPCLVGILLLPCLAGDLCAADAEGSGELRSLVDRIFSPNMDRTIQHPEFRTGPAREMRAFSGSDKEFHWIRRSLKKEYRTAEFDAGRDTVRREGGSARIHPTGKAYFGKHKGTRSPSETPIRTGSVRTGQASDANRVVEAGQVPDADRSFQGRGTAQGALDQAATSSKRLTVDQVREILNRND